MLLNRRLGISGWLSLPMSLVISRFGRQVINEAKPELLNTFGSSNQQELEINHSDFYVVHNTPGRVRIRVPQLVSDSHLVRRLERQANEVSGVKTIRVSSASTSIVITHQFSSNEELRSQLTQLINTVLDKPTVTLPVEEVMESQQVENKPIETQQVKTQQVEVESSAVETPQAEIVPEQKQSWQSLNYAAPAILKISETQEKTPEKDGKFAEFKSGMLLRFLELMAGRPMPCTAH
ncbi:MAG: hypothetical protein SWJ54_24300, partial [Cyanobacteriota bacterium]|nr:hypothetical protein [Cyanobacteriota bacterium]